jgi:hypothetical protein
MGKSQRTKGATFEREISIEFSRALGMEFKRNIGQARDGGNDIAVGPLVIECKRRKTLGTVYGWLRQAADACSSRGSIFDIEADPNMPVVVAREDGGESIVIMKLDDFLTLTQDKLRSYILNGF